MQFLELFLTFFKIGLFTFGGGYGMIPIIQQEVTEKGWLSAEMINTFIGISETTPGPIAINMATFVGSSVGDAAGSSFLGALVATLGVVLPSFIIILIIASVFKTFAQNRFVRSVLSGIRPIVVGLIVSTGVIIAYGNLVGEKSFDFISLIMMAVVALTAFVYKKIKKKDLSPILIIVGCALVGMIVYGI